VPFANDAPEHQHQVIVITPGYLRHERLNGEFYGTPFGKTGQYVLATRLSVNSHIADKVLTPPVVG